MIFSGARENGAYEVAELLLGSSKMLRQLAMLDVKNPIRDITHLFAGFPSHIEALPQNDTQDLFDSAFWASSTWQTRCSNTWESTRIKGKRSRRLLIPRISPTFTGRIKMQLQRCN